MRNRKICVIFIILQLFYIAACSEKMSALKWKWVVEPGKYEDLYFISDNLIAVQDEGKKYAIMNLQDGTITPFQYDCVGAYSDERAVIGRGEEVYYIDYDGKAVGENAFESARKFSENMGAVKQDNLWGYIDFSGELVIPCQYSEVLPFHEGMAAVQIGNKWGFIDKSGILIIANQYDAVRDFQEGYAAVSKGDKWGFIDREGNLCIGCKYNAVGNFSEGKAAVKVDNYVEGIDAWAYINPQDEVIIDFYPYEASGECMFYVGEFTGGVAFVSEALLTLIDTEGNEVFGESRFFISSPYYDEEFDIIPGYVYVDDEMKTRKYGLAGLNGEQRVEPIFDYVDSISDKYVVVSNLIDGEYKKGIIELIRTEKSVSGSTDSSSANMDKDAQSAENNFEKKEEFSHTDSDILYQMTWDDEYIANVYRLLRSGAGEYAEKYRGEFQPVFRENSSFAPELIYQMESVLYELCNARLSIETEYESRRKAYLDAVKNLGADKYKIDEYEFMERFPDLCGEGLQTLVSVFDISDTSDRECYVLVYDNGGTNGACSISMAVVTNEEDVSVSRLFETQNEGNGSVVNYDGELYYIFRQYNYNLKNYDGIRIYRLGEHAKEDNILIRYLPEDYVWERIYYLDLESGWDRELDAYIESIKEEITSDRYMERGLARDAGG